MYYELTVNNITQHADALVEFHGKFRDHIRTSTRSVALHALDYLKGQLFCESRRNMSRMSVQITDKNEQVLSPFISISPWRDDPLIMAIGKHGVELLSEDGTSGALILDKCGIPKQGTESVGVWRIEYGIPCPQVVCLVIHQELGGSDTKFSFCNAPETTPIETLAEWQSRRYWVECSLQDAKGLAGLDEYQVTGWRGWHHHMTMVMLAMLFLLNLKHKLSPKAPMLTLQDAKEILWILKC